MIDLTPKKQQSNRMTQASLFKPIGPLNGKIRVPGDKSISHRAIMFASLAIGTSKISGLLEGEDVMASADAMRSMGAHITCDDGIWRVTGVGVGGLMQPKAALDMGNSGTSTRLLMGLVASHAIEATFIGDASLSSRPMARVTNPLAMCGATFNTSPGGTLPAMVRGIVPALPITYELPIASAQVKSAVLLAGLNTAGVTTVIEPTPTRDHSERMLKGFGADLSVATRKDGAKVIKLRGETELQPQNITVPGDPSSAAFPVVAALITEDSDIIVENVGMNPTRTGLFTMLKQMGGDLEFLNERSVGGEDVADIHVRHSALKAITVPADVAPSMIDEFPIFFVAAAMAQGVTRTSGLDELRVKESDRLSLMAEGLKSLGVELKETPDGLIITGSSGAMLSGSNATIKTALDHRIAMSFAIAGQVTNGGVHIDDMAPVRTSFPAFEDMLKELQS